MPSDSPGGPPILVTGAGRPLGRELAAHLAATRAVRQAGDDVDLRSEDLVKSLVAGADAIVHAAEFDPVPRAENEVLDHAALGAYRLFSAARAAGVERIVVISRLSFYDAYDPNLLVDELWQPLPATAPSELAPFLMERVAQEFCREGGIRAVCLRILPLGDDIEANTSLQETLGALDAALRMPIPAVGRRWHVFHITSSPRFITRSARLALGFRKRRA